MAITGLTTFLWFDTQGLEAAIFYASVFPDSRVTEVTHYGSGMPGPEGAVMTASFELFGQPFVALNGGPMFPHTEAVSFQVACDTQEEIDRLWGAITADGGEPGRCGWCKDRFGVSWQIVPSRLAELLSRDGAMAAMMTMGKFDIAALEAAGR